MIIFFVVCMKIFTYKHHCKHFLTKLLGVLLYFSIKSDYCKCFFVKANVKKLYVKFQYVLNALYSFMLSRSITKCTACDVAFIIIKHTSESQLCLQTCSCNIPVTNCAHENKEIVIKLCQMPFVMQAFTFILNL